jgi:hypothetical protein
MPRSSRNRAYRRYGALASAVTAVGLLAIPLPAAAGGTSHHRDHPDHSACHLANGVKHVINIQFDNVHLTRDNPNVASDLQQMPHLLNFLTGNGVVLANTHDVLVHTATNFISNQTGLYPDRTGITQSNSYNYYDPAGATHGASSFAYWTDPISSFDGDTSDPTYNTIYTADRSNEPSNTNANVPAPWVPFTRTGCNVGEVGMSNEVLENTTSDLVTVFGANSPQVAEAKANPAKAQADYVGLAVHCGRGQSLCAQGQTDALPDEPGGYSGYKALFGNAQIQPAVSPSGPIQGLDGTAITDGKGNPGFPGFDSETPNVSLGYAAALLEHGVQINNIYLSDVHGNHTAAHTGDLGPGEQTYEQQLREYDQGFAAFFARLERDGITAKNTLFTVSTDEGDHFSGSDPSPANCTGQPGNYCTYTTKSEVNVNLPGLLATQSHNTTPFAIHNDPAPAIWVTGNPARTSTTARQLARDIGRLSITNPLTGNTDQVAYQLADPVEEKILHFVSADARRTPTLTLFSGEDEYVGSGAANCSKPCVYTSSGFAWNHGGIWPDMQNIWSAYVGPGVSARGIDRSTWTDQTDMRPTMLALLGLRDDYAVDGRVLIEDVSSRALPRSLQAHRKQLLALGRVYKQLLAADGAFAEDTLAASTRALKSGSSGHDDVYTRIENALVALDSQRNSLTASMAHALLSAAFGGRTIDSHRARDLTRRGDRLLDRAASLTG